MDTIHIYHKHTNTECFYNSTSCYYEPFIKDMSQTFINKIKTTDLYQSYRRRRGKEIRRRERGEKMR